MIVKNDYKKFDVDIPLFFAVDDNYAPFLAVVLRSIIDNCNKKYHYSVYVLHDGLKDKTVRVFKKYEDENFSFRFVNVKLKRLMYNSKLHTRDYYSKSTYYRLFIQNLFPKIDKALYLDSDIIVNGDISELYFTDIENYLVGAAVEDVMQNVDVFGTYVEKALGINRNKFFNAGVLVLNLKKFREEKVESRFLKLISEFKFSVTQDEDYLNVICKDKIKYVEKEWNLSPAVYSDKKINLIHYKMDLKPWHYDGVRYGDYFWKYAVNTEVYNELINMKNNYGEADKQKDKDTYVNLVALAKKETVKEDSYFNSLLKKTEVESADFDGDSLLTCRI